jgi:hypothetical protein
MNSFRVVGVPADIGTEHLPHITRSVIASARLKGVPLQVVLFFFPEVGDTESTWYADH